MTTEIHLGAEDEIKFEPHNANCFLLLDADGQRIWVDWDALPELRQAVDAAWKAREDR